MTSAHKNVSGLFVVEILKQNSNLQEFVLIRLSQLIWEVYHKHIANNLHLKCYILYMVTKLKCLKYYQLVTNLAQQI